MASSRGALVLWLPPYSPHRNAIEYAFSKFKAGLVGTVGAADFDFRDFDDAWVASLRAITHSDMRGYAHKAGYISGPSPSGVGARAGFAAAAAALSAAAAAVP